MHLTLNTPITIFSVDEINTVCGRWVGGREIDGGGVDVIILTCLNDKSIILELKLWYFF